MLPAKPLKPGAHRLTLKYLGTGYFAPSTGSVKVRVIKAKPKVKINVADTIDKCSGGKVASRSSRRTTSRRGARSKLTKSAPASRSPAGW